MPSDRRDSHARRRSRWHSRDRPDLRQPRRDGRDLRAGDALATDRLFLDPFYATGLPLTEPYWMTVAVTGQSHQVLVQAFERRVMTYTPANPTGWQVEAGNVGRHYYEWRYTE